MKTLRASVEMPLDRFDLAVDLTATTPTTGVFGPSGAGKSSLLQAIAGLRPAARGRVSLGDSVWLDSARGVELPPDRRGVGYVPQDGLLFPHLNVRGNLLAGARRAAGTDAAAFEAVVELLDLESLLDRGVAALSGGERQRVALGRALCSGPEILLLDEPLVALDLPMRRRLLAMLRRVRHELTVPMLFISHDPIEIQALCEHVVVLAEGKVHATGEPARVLSDPAIVPPAVQAGVGFANLLVGRVHSARPGATEVRLAEGPTLTVGPAPVQANDEVLLELPADRILLATEAPAGLSARNALPATIQRLRPADGVTLVDARLEAAGPPLVVEVTDSTPGRLGLEPGRRVHVVFKATSCRLHSETGAAGD